MNSDAVAPMVIFVVLALSAAGTLILRGPLGRALAKRIEGTKSADEETVQRQEEVEARLQSLELIQERILELEERLDFAERLLAGQRSSEPLPQGRIGES